MNTRTEDVLKRFAEWLDGEGLMDGAEASLRARNHETLIRQFLDFEAGRLEGTMAGSMELDYRGELEEKVAKQRDLLERAWGLLANVSGGDWAKQSGDWRQTAERWRDNLFSGANYLRTVGQDGVESSDAAAQRLARELTRLAGALKAMNISLRDGPVEGAEVDTAIAVIRDMREHVERLETMSQLWRTEHVHSSARIVKVEEQAKANHERLMEAYAVLRGVWPAVSDKELAAVLYRAVEGRPAEEVWATLPIQDKDKWIGYAQRVAARVSGGLMGPAMDYAQMATKYAEAASQLEEIEEWLRLNLPGFDREGLSTGETVIKLFYFLKQFAQFGLGVIRSAWPALENIVRMLGYEWKDGKWVEVTDWEDGSDDKPASPDAG